MLIEGCAGHPGSKPAFQRFGKDARPITLRARGAYENFQILKDHFYETSPATAQ
jgi:hypothetical protein